MDFTREPIIETVITPKEGCKLVVRSSKSTGQEEYFVDAIEVVSFGHSFFFRSLERPKAFLVPVSDYEILEVREARMVLKNVGVDRAIKIGGGRDAQMRGPREQIPEKAEINLPAEEYAESIPQSVSPTAAEPKSPEARIDKKRDRRRHYRRRRGREEDVGGEEGRDIENKDVPPKIELPEPRKLSEGGESPLALPITTTSILTSLLPPPPTLISETIARYKDNALFRGAFYSKEEPKVPDEEGQKPVVPLEQPAYGTFEVSEEEEEQIYQLRKLHNAREDEGSSEDRSEDEHSDDGSKESKNHLENLVESSQESYEDEVKNGNDHL